MEDLAPTIAILAIFFSFAYVARVFLDHRARMKIAQLQSDIHMKVLDRFSSAQEIAAYMESAAGKKLLETSHDEGSATYRRVQGAMIAGFVLLAGGVGLLNASVAFVSADDIRGLTVFGTLLKYLGLGFLVASLSTYLLAKQWGLINGRGGKDDNGQPDSSQ